jgi:DNA-binding transcriptional regulator PaaX
VTSLAAQPAPGAEAFRAFAAATLPIHDASSRDPDLPAELLPADWPRDQLAQALQRANRTFYPLIRTYLEDLAG